MKECLEWLQLRKLAIKQLDEKDRLWQHQHSTNALQHNVTYTAFGATHNSASYRYIRDRGAHSTSRSSCETSDTNKKTTDGEDQYAQRNARR